MSSYKSMSDSFMLPASDYVNDNWVQAGENCNFFKRHIAGRSGHLVMIPFSVLTTVLDTIIGVGAGITALVTAGTQETLLRGAVKHLRNSRLILALPFKEILLTINPSASFSSPLDDNFGNSRLGNGVIVAQLDDPLITLRDKLRSKNPFLKHVGSRFFHAVMMVSQVVARILDFVIGLVAAPLALLTLGKINLLNVLAFRGLQVTGVIDDVMIGLISVINPDIFY